MGVDIDDAHTLAQKTEICQPLGTSRS